MPGGYGGGAIPVPIPNTEVKPPCADGTAPLRRGRVGGRRAFLFSEFFWKAAPYGFGCTGKPIPLPLQGPFECIQAKWGIAAYFGGTIDKA